MKKHKILTTALILVSVQTLHAQQWNAPQSLTIPIAQEAKPYTRWWWLGSAVDTAGISYNLSEYAKAGIGGVEITPIYGVKGNDANEISYLSSKWMQMLRHVEAKGTELGIETNMVTGTGWPFGGPWVPKEEAASKAVFTQSRIPAPSAKSTRQGKRKFRPQTTDSTTVYTVEAGRTEQMVKRAAPGGEGFVVDHYDRDAVAHYLNHFDKAFAQNGAKPYSKVTYGTSATPATPLTYPHTFFNDSYEVYGADWTPRLPEEFKARRGYDLTEHLESLVKADSLRTDEDKRILSDYRETMGELLYENFTSQWTDWAHSHGSITRNQAHGSPANLLDLYARVDIPECEGFGLSDFSIKGLRLDPGFTKKNFSDISMLKYASSGAHLSGARYTSSETFTWLTEHFRTSLSQCKPDLDLFFVSGINHVFFHGSCYSPEGAEWPGWRFYASVDMSPANNWWSSMPAFTDYITRCQSFLQWGEADNDVLVYLPFYDMIYDQPGTIAMFDIHSMEKRAPKFIETVQSIIRAGYDVDYISDRYILRDNVTRRYSAIIIPDVRFMPLQTLRQLDHLAKKGIKVIFVKSYPESVPGYGRDAERDEFNAILARLKSETALVGKYGEGLDGTGARPEPMRTELGVSCIRRSNADGFHYFVSNLQGKDIDSYISLGVKATSALFYNPMNGNVTRASMDASGKVRLQLRSGESIIIRTFNNKDNAEVQAHAYLKDNMDTAIALRGWTLCFPVAAPDAIEGTWQMEKPQSWTELDSPALKTTMATGRYTTTVKLGKIKEHYILDLGDVRETAHVIINGQDAGTLFAVPYRMDVTQYLKKGKNTITVDVANLPANRIAELDRQGVEWRKFKEINVVDLNYKRDRYDSWTPVPSGLCSDVYLIPSTQE